MYGKYTGAKETSANTCEPLKERKKKIFQDLQKLNKCVENITINQVK